MSTKLLSVTTDSTIIPVNFRGLSGFCTGWAGDDEGAVYVSLIGRVTAITGIWAAFQSNETLILPRRSTIFKRPKLEGATYHTLRVRLPETGWLHLVLLHTQATMRNLPNADCYILSSSPEPPLEAFWIQWNNALPLPALQEWTFHLWEQGLRQRLIIPCPAEATCCWVVKADSDAWGKIIQHIATEVK